MEIALCLHRYLHQNKLALSHRAITMELALSHRGITMLLILVEVSVKVACQATFTSTPNTISCKAMALWLQSVTVVNRQATLTDTSTRIMSMVMALWLESVTVN